MVFPRKYAGAPENFPLNQSAECFLNDIASTKLKPLPPRCRHFVIRRIHGGGLFRGEGERRDLAHQCGP